MNCLMKIVLQFVLVSSLLFISAATGFAAEVRRVPSKASVEQGFLALTLDAEGAEDFRYTGEENKTHMYRGTIKPGSKLQFTIRATLADQKSLPITGRSCIMRLKVVAKKGNEVLKTQNFSKENKSNVFVNYTVPEGADTLEVSETFVLSNKSKEEKCNQKVTSLNKLILTTSDAAVAGNAAKKTDEKNGDKKTDTGKDKTTDKKDNAKDSGGDKNETGNDKKSGSDNGTTETAGDAKESKGISTKMLVGAVVALAAIGGGGFFYMKKSKEGRDRAEEIARKEKLRQQAIQRQKELQQQNLQRSQEERDQRSRMLEEKRMRMEEEARQQVQWEEQQRAEQQQRMMQEQPHQQRMQQEAEQQSTMQQQNAIQQQPDVAQQQPGAAGAFVVGAAGVMGGMQNNAAENVQKNVPNTAPQFCINCGAPLKPGTKFCENCGAKV